jgi:hypothetical protein
VLPFSSAFADTLLTSETVHWNSTLGAYITGVNNAQASGYVKVCNKGSSKVFYNVKEYDEGSNQDEVITYDSLYPGDCRSYDISGFVDGSNGKAEIYLQTSTKGAKFALYD